MLRGMRGMPDILPQSAGIWLDFEAIISKLFNRFGLSQIRIPLVEMTALFSRSIGNATDIVEKEMYTFDDRSGDSLSLRPELTAGIVRASIEHNLLYKQTQRLWSAGPIFRYERPQKGRYRQFHQVGVEFLGFTDAMADVELIEIASSLWAELGISDLLTLNLNTIGSEVARKEFKKHLVDFLKKRKMELDIDSQNRLEHNPLRILDSKNKLTQELLDDGPVMTDFLTELDLEHFSIITSELDKSGIKYTVNRRLVRGLDYYNRTVFEWTTDLIGSQATICGGGRYDGLVELLGGKPTPAVGFAIGVERLFLLKDQMQLGSENTVDIFLIAQEKKFESTVRALARDIRQELVDLSVVVNMGNGSLKSQLKKADKSGARVGLIIGANEFTDGTLILKPLRGGAQKIVSRQKAIEELKKLF